MKKIITLITAIIMTACTTVPQCDFTKVEITSQIGDGEMERKTLEGCFTKSAPDELGLIEITDSENRMRILYYQEQQPGVLHKLNVKFGDNAPSEWRSNKGHDLFIVEQTDTLGIIFGDRNSAAGAIKGTLKFTK